MAVKRIYVQKRENFDIEAKGMLADLRENLLINNLENVIILNRYDVSGISDEDFKKAKTTIFSEPQVDICFEEEYPFDKNDAVFGIEFLPGQFDQRANSLSECLQIITEGTRPTAKTAKIYINIFTDVFKYTFGSISIQNINIVINIYFKRKFNKYRNCKNKGIFNKSSRF